MHRVAHLVRHGESVWNAAGIMQGQTAHVPLTAEGRRQAETLAATLATETVDQIWTSDLLRASQTADIIAARHGLTPVPEKALRERSFGSLEGGPSDIVERNELRHGRGADPDHRPGGGESLREVYARVAELVARLPAGATVLVTHGVTLAVAVAVITGRPVDDIGPADYPNGSVLTLSLR